jgi:hypothetical protein
MAQSQLKIQQIRWVPEGHILAWEDLRPTWAGEKARFNRLALFNLLSEDLPRFSRRPKFFATPSVAYGFQQFALDDLPTFG